MMISTADDRRLRSTPPGGHRVRLHALPQAQCRRFAPGKPQPQAVPGALAVSPRWCVCAPAGSSVALPTRPLPNRNRWRGRAMCAAGRALRDAAFWVYRRLRAEALAACRCYSRIRAVFAVGLASRRGWSAWRSPGAVIRAFALYSRSAWLLVVVGLPAARCLPPAACPLLNRRAGFEEDRREELKAPVEPGQGELNGAPADHRRQ
jgi:hypothetical protein